MVEETINKDVTQSDSEVSKNDIDAGTVNTSQEINNLDVVLNIPVDVSLELGRASVDLKSLIDFNQGSVIELNRLVDEPVDVLVNGCLVAKAEVVVVENKFGARITDIVSPEKRVENLKKNEN